MTDLDLAAIRTRANAATGDRWERTYPGTIEAHVGNRLVRVLDDDPDDRVVITDADADFIAHSKQDVDDLLDALDAVLALHKRGTEYPVRNDECEACMYRYPCPTARAAGVTS